MPQPQFSIVTCISQPTVYADCLLKSINDCRQSHDIEIIPVLNTDNRYSASVALNLGLDVATANYVIFAHQDVCLLFDWFGRLTELLDQVPEDWGILGSAGIALQFGRADIGRWGGALDVQTVAVGSVWSSAEVTVPPYWDGLKDLTPVHCADECLLVVNKRTGLRFDGLFTGFHFYGVDMCLQARAAGYHVYGAHLPIIHYGRYSASFTDDNRYWAYLRLLHNKWRLRFPEMLGTHMHWSSQELTSYIQSGLESDGCRIHLKAVGISKVRLSGERLLEF